MGQNSQLLNDCILFSNIWWESKFLKRIVAIFYSTKILYKFLLSFQFENSLLFKKPSIFCDSAKNKNGIFISFKTLNFNYNKELSVRDFYRFLNTNKIDNCINLLNIQYVEQYNCLKILNNITNNEAELLAIFLSIIFLSRVKKKENYYILSDSFLNIIYFLNTQNINKKRKTKLHVKILKYIKNHQLNIKFLWIPRRLNNADLGFKK